MVLYPVRVLQRRRNSAGELLGQLPELRNFCISRRFSRSQIRSFTHLPSRSPQILLRSSRVVATMIGGIFILGKRFMVIEYVGVLLVAAGMVVFSSGDVNAAKAGTEFSSLIIGVVLNIVSLAMNSFQDNYQEKGLHAMRLSENDMVRYLHAR